MLFTVILLVVATPPLPPVALQIDRATHLTLSRGVASHHEIDLPIGTVPLFPAAAATTVVCGGGGGVRWRRRSSVLVRASCDDGERGRGRSVVFASSAAHCRRHEMLKP